MSEIDPVVVAKGLSEAQRKALQPFAFFPHVVGAEMIDLGLFNHDDGVWTHTRLGLAVRAILEKSHDGRAYVAGKGRPATQVAWELAYGRPFPDGKCACHSCDNPICVNRLTYGPGPSRKTFSIASPRGGTRASLNLTVSVAICSMRQTVSARAVSRDAAHAPAKKPRSTTGGPGRGGRRQMDNVIQADREAAAALLELNFRAEGWTAKAIQTGTWPVLQGKVDHCDEVQAFARHRTAALEDAMKAVANSSSLNTAGYARAAGIEAIRNLKDQPR